MGAAYGISAVALSVEQQSLASRRRLMQREIPMLSNSYDNPFRAIAAQNAQSEIYNRMYSQEMQTLAVRKQYASVIRRSEYYADFIDNEPKAKEQGMIAEVKKDLKDFLKEHKNLVYWTLGLILIDRFYFDGMFEEKLKKIVEKMIGKVEKKLDALGGSDEA